MESENDKDDFQTLVGLVNPEYVDPKMMHLEHRNRLVRGKYDQISIHVQIDNYEYVFSRFNMSRYLMACKIPPHIAVDISRSIKKSLVDKNVFTLTQKELNQRVFEIATSMGIDSESFQHNFKIIERFNFERVPLIIFIAGTGFIGKSTISFDLGERLNISTILQTDLVYAMAKNSSEHLGRDLWFTPHKSTTEFMEQYHADCSIVQHGIEGDIIKTLSDGKPLIVEGIHLDPDLFLQLCGSNSIIELDGFKKESFGCECRGKKGFILPLLLVKTKPEILRDISAAVYESGLTTLNIENMTDYAMEIQNELISKFPPEYRIEIGDDDIIERIHTFFLQKLGQYYNNPLD